MADKVKLSKDGSSIDFVQSESIPTSVKKFRQSPEIEGFYRFVYENDLQKEVYEIMERIVQIRKAKKLKDKQEAQPAKKVAAAAATATAAKKVDIKKAAPAPLVKAKAALPVAKKIEVKKKPVVKKK